LTAPRPCTLGPRGRGGFGLAGAALLALALFWAAPLLRQEAAPVASAALGERWQPWSPERVAQAHAEGRTVFVDFTAAWCVTCQINKRALNDDAVLAEFDARRVLLLRADWTRRDAVIAAELQRLGRSGVPVYAFYAPGAVGPRILSEILTTAEIRAALAATPL
jgi:thiol:disulfide interchange protein